LVIWGAEGQADNEIDTEEERKGRLRLDTVSSLRESEMTRTPCERPPDSLPNYIPVYESLSAKTNAPQHKTLPTSSPDKSNLFERKRHKSLFKEINSGNPRFLLILHLTFVPIVECMRFCLPIL